MRSYCILILLIVSTAAYSADKSGNYAVWGVGSKSCHSYRLARDADDYDKYKDYVLGYFTAYNILTPETYRISGEMTLDDILIWFDDECGTKPVISFEEAISNFIIEHHEKRMKSPPTSYRR